MDSPSRMPNANSGGPQHAFLSPCTSSSSRGARRSSTANDTNSPEFEFWMVRNPSFPQPNLLSADQLFVDGVLLPLHLLHLHNNNPAFDPPDREDPEPEPEPKHEPGPPISRPSITTESTTTTLSASKRWKDIIFKKTTTTKKREDKDRDKDKKKEKKRERRNQSGGSSSNSSAELNIINIWPFSRSRSAGNSYGGTTRPKIFSGASGARKVSSAPCSRSNSAGESKSRKWPSSPGRPGGVHLGRSSPVWQVRRGGGGETGVMHYASKKDVVEPCRGKTTTTTAGAKARVLNLNVPICIGYRQHFTCRSHESSAIGVSSTGDSASGGGGGSTAHNTINSIVGNGGNLFNFRSFFAKKVY